LKHLIQSLKNGNLELIDTPMPSLKKGEILVKNTLSLISPGTEKMMLEFGNANYIDKVRQQPDKAKMVLNKIKTDGLNQTIESVKNKLDQPISLGYSTVGKVLAKADDVSDFSIGDRVITNGPHSEVVKVSKNLCAKVPDGLSDESAVFTVISSIAMQGIRLAKPNIGDNYAVIGVGLIGLLTIQLLKANGCNVLAIDFDDSRLELAKNYGADICNPNVSDPVNSAFSYSNNVGVDGVIIAAATKSNEPVSSAANMCRKRGKIILVGVTGLDLKRDDFYEKEISFQVSCSYGPGRYDENYEKKGNDYPVGYVRWTEKRNFEAVLNLLDQKKLSTADLITRKVDFSEAVNLYKSLLSDSNKDLGVIFKYSNNVNRAKLIKLEGNNDNLISNKISLGCIGAGDYASKVLLPLFKKNKVSMNTLVSTSGLSSSLVGRSNSFQFSSSAVSDIFNNSTINLVAIASSHESHAAFVEQSLASKQNVYVEKPLSINLNQLESIKTSYINAHNKTNGPHLMVGFNRRFSPHAKKIKELLQSRVDPVSMVYTINAGKIPSDHWIQDLAIGGGRVVGEVCHFVDLMRFIVGKPIQSFVANKAFNHKTPDINDDDCSITMSFVDGSMGTIHYFANGSPSLSKERIEIFCEGRVLALDNFKKMKGYGWKNFSKMNLFNQDKGQKNCVGEFIKSLGKDEPLIDSNEIFEVTKVSIDIANSLRS
jgi:predicted dehydrogenase/threonine dehydrogenase-like Zn-dependent dehydrogenase